jgi:hypothetical protein
MLYTPRCGSTSILRYFKKIKPEFEIINQPWSKAISELENRKQLKYSDIIKKNNIFVKSTINVIFELKFSILNIKNDFDKIIILDRKDTKEQLESYAWAEKHNSFLESSKYLMDYNLDSNTYEICNNILLREKTNIEFLKKELNAKLFYYEDLYYGDFKPILNELQLEYNQVYYNEYLNISNKYRINNIDVKNHKSLI